MFCKYNVSLLPMSFISFSCLIALAGNSSIVLNRSDDSRHPYLIPNFKENTFNISNETEKKANHHYSTRILTLSICILGFKNSKKSTHSFHFETQGGYLSEKPSKSETRSHILSPLRAALEE